MFDVLFIDGCHDYEFVKKDFNNYIQFLADDGYVIFHDIKHFGPSKFINEIENICVKCIEKFSVHKRQRGLGLYKLIK